MRKAPYDISRQRRRRHWLTCTFAILLGPSWLTYRIFGFLWIFWIEKVLIGVPISTGGSWHLMTYTWSRTLFPDCGLYLCKRHLNESCYAVWYKDFSLSDYKSPLYRFVILPSDSRFWDRKKGSTLKGKNLLPRIIIWHAQADPVHIEH